MESVWSTTYEIQCNNYKLRKYSYIYDDNKQAWNDKEYVRVIEPTTKEKTNHFQTLSMSLVLTSP